MFEYALKSEDFSPNEVLMVGDRYDNDIQGAQYCHINTALLKDKQVSVFSGYTPDFVINYLADVLDIIEYSKENKLLSAVGDFKPFKYQPPLRCAFITAGGKGTRLGEISLTKQKCMLPIWDGKPLLYYVLESLRSVGCNKVVIAVDYLKEQIKDYFKDGNDFDIEICYIEGNFQSTYDAICHSLNSLSDTFYYVHGDILFHPNLLVNLNRKYHSNHLGTVALISNKNIHLTHAQMDVEKEHIKAIDLSERDERFPYTFLGAAIYNKNDFIDNFDGNYSGMVEKVIYQKLVKNEKMNAVVYEGGWRHIEKIEDYQRVAKENKWGICFE
jgi:NDP-sugar pyrophosphorylase family protein